MKKIAIINGPNLNLLGTREPDVYGSVSFLDFLADLKNQYLNIDIDYYQSNIEGEIIDYLHGCIDKIDAIIINPGGYSHTSVAISDALKAINVPCIEVHISNIYKRETYRHISLTATSCIGVISGLGYYGYKSAIDYFLYG